jgi:methyl-accepting chemotaxis protein
MMATPATGSTEAILSAARQPGPGRRLLAWIRRRWVRDPGPAPVQDDRLARLLADTGRLPQAMCLAVGHLRDINDRTESGALAILGALGQVRDRSRALLEAMEARRDQAEAISAERTRRLADNARALEGLRAFQVSRGDRLRADGGRISLILERVQGLAGLVENIRGVADRTELLALNAAIEAAHAGALGRGFAVVAEEVGNLSRQAAGTVEQVERELSDLGRVFHENLAAIADLARQEDDPRRIQELADGFAEVNQAYDQACGCLDQATGSACEAMHGVHDDVVQALGQLQFQDVVRQQVEHVVLLLDTLSSHFAGADPGSGGQDATPLAVRLEALREHHVMHSQRATHAAVVQDGTAAESGPAIELF